MSVRSQHTLDANVGEVAIGVGGGNAVGAAVIGTAVVDVVARGKQVGGAELVVQLSDDDVAIEAVGAAADVVIGISQGSGTVRQRVVTEGGFRDRVEPVCRDDVTG